MDEVSVDFLTCVVLFLLLAVSVLLLLYVVLIDLHQLPIPVLGVHRVHHHKDLRTKLVVNSLLVFQLDFHVAALPLADSVYSL